MQAASPTKSFKAGRLNSSEAISTDLTCLAAYDGTDLAGFIVERVGAFIAYDRHDRLIGSFPTLHGAVRSIPVRCAPMSLLPKLPAHRPNAATKAAYQEKVEAFCATLLEVKSRLDFDVGSRGWAYVLEGDRLIDKDEIDAAQQLINDCRKSGDLPLDFCSEDGKRAVENLEDIDGDPQERAAKIFNYIQTAENYYTPFSFWDDLDAFVQMATEKSNLKNLFSKVCAEFCMPIANIGGWADLNVRAGFMQRFEEKEAEGKQCVLLYCGDFDPGGLQISNFLRSNLKDMERAVGWSPDDLTIDHFGLDYDFIERESSRGLRTSPPPRASIRSTTSGIPTITSPMCRTT